jgi:hypothetical protein
MNINQLHGTESFKRIWVAQLAGRFSFTEAVKFNVTFTGASAGLYRERHESSNRREAAIHQLNSYSNINCHADKYKATSKGNIQTWKRDRYIISI